MNKTQRRSKQSNTTNPIHKHAHVVDTSVVMEKTYLNVNCDKQRESNGSDFCGRWKSYSPNEW